MLSTLRAWHRKRRAQEVQYVPRRWSLAVEALEERVTPSHVRYMNLSWEPAASDSSGRTIEFHFHYAWRLGGYLNDSAVGNIIELSDVNENLAFGDSVLAAVFMRVTAVNTVEGWALGEAVHQVSSGIYDEGMSHTYTGSGTYLAYWAEGASNSPGRIDTLQNAAGAYAHVETIVNVGTGNSSPSSSLAPIVQVIDDRVNSFAVPAADPDGDRLTFRLATRAEAQDSDDPGPAYVHPPGLTVNANTGLVTWDITSAANPGVAMGQLWTTQIVIEDHDVSSNVKSKTPVDFILQVVDIANNPPVFDSPPTPTTTLTTQSGQPLVFTVQASDPDFGDTVSFQPLNLPMGMTSAPTTTINGSRANAVALQYSWTPTITGTFVITYQATDNHGRTGMTAVTIKVVHPAVVITESGGSTDVTEGGATDTYTAVLYYQPTANVTVTPHPDAQVTVSPARLIFTSINWSTPQTVTVTAVDDRIVEGLHTGLITHTASSSDTKYDNIAVASVIPNITDNDFPELVFDPAGPLALLEGTNRTYTAVLSVAPTNPVTLTLTSADTSQLSVSPSTLVFDAGNWNKPQTVTVSAADNSAIDGNRLIHVAQALATTDPLFTRTVVPDMLVEIVDDENVLFVNGSENPDKINVLFSPSAIQVVVNSWVKFYKPTYSQVVVLAGGGADRIQITNPTLPVAILAGMQSDQVTIDGQPGANAFTVDGFTVNVNGREVVAGDVENLTINGKGAADTLTLRNVPVFPLTFQAGAGADRLIAPDQANTWKITGSDAGTLDGSIAFSGMENPTGGSGDDMFIFGAGKLISGQLDGGAGSNTLDLSACTTPITANLQTGTITGTKTFRNISTLIGGSGLDKLIGANGSNTWNITGTNAGTVAGLSFRGFENLTGGNLADTFVFADGQRVQGKIDGGGGTDILDFSSYLTAVTVNLQAKTATNTGGWLNLEQFRGGSGTDTLIGANKTNVWNLTGMDAGDIGGSVFANFENLTGGTAADLFNLSTGAGWLGLLDGGIGADVLTAIGGGSYISTGPGAGTLNGYAFKGIETRR